MSTDLRLRVVTPSGPVVDISASSITACSDVGEFCVLPEHRPILAALKPGRFMFESGGENRIYVMDVGFFEGGMDHANVMTQHCVPLSTVLSMVEDLRHERDELTGELAALEDDSPARTTLSSRLQWVEAQLTVAQQ